jgi:hypothetical protein
METTSAAAFEVTRWRSLQSWLIRVAKLADEMMVLDLFFLGRGEPVKREGEWRVSGGHEQLRPRSRESRDDGHQETLVVIVGARRDPPWASRVEGWSR